MLEQRGYLIRNLVTVVFALISFFWNCWVVLPRPTAPHLPLSHPLVYQCSSFSPVLTKCAILVCSAGSISDTVINGGTN